MIRAALITAAGVGARMQSSVPKQFLSLAGIPILKRTITVFDKHPLVDFIVITLPKQIGIAESVIYELPDECTKPVKMVPGGDSRQESVMNGLYEANASDYVAIHDGVRPFISNRVITETFHAAEEGGAAIACVPITETIKRQHGRHLETVPRSDLWLARTPQTFRTDLITHAHERARSDNFVGTDDASLLERLGFEIKIIEDERTNLKITSPADLVMAEIILKALNSDLQPNYS